MEAEVFSFKMQVLAGLLLEKQSQNAGKLFMANIYTVYRAVKLVAMVLK